MRKEVKIVRGLISREVDPFATKVLPDPSALNPTTTSKADNWSRTIFGRAVRRALLAISIMAAAAALSGCLSVHVHKDVDQPAPVIVVPNNQPSP
jgi:hypothetical protein